MNSTAEKRCLDDRSAFQPCIGKEHLGVDIWIQGGNDANVSETIVLESSLDEPSIHSWMVNQIRPPVPASRVALRLLICAPRKEFQEMLIPISANSFSRLISTWALPPLILPALRQPYSVITPFNTPSTPDALLLRFDCHWERECALILLPPDAKTQTATPTRAVLMGLTPSQIPLITSLLKNSSSLAQHPMLLPVLLLSELVQNQTDWLGLISPDLDDIQRRLGMANWGYASDSPFFGPDAAENLAKLDLPGIITKLNRMADSIRFQDQCAASLVEVLDELFERTKQDAGLQIDWKINEELRDTVVLLGKAMKGCQKRTAYRSGTIHGLIDTVYTLIAQRDNYLSLDVALHARRDSTDMRMIAAVTLFFLPGMFTATLFSTTFFDFKAANPSEMLSPYHWVYWMTTGTATAAVLGFWFMYTKRKMKDPLPDILGMNQPLNSGGGAPLKRTYNTTDFPMSELRSRRFAGW